MPPPKPTPIKTLLLKSADLEAAAAQRKRLAALEDKKRLLEDLPHLYKFKDYSWAKEFLNSRNRKCFLVAGNQVGKSVCQIRKMITWATSPQLWPHLWETRPVLFWVLYPSKEMATQEFQTKWKYILPGPRLREHPDYGWKERYIAGKIGQIEFNNGVIIAFKAYSQDADFLQAGTVHYVGLDEECPPELLPELFLRLAANRGYLSAAFTATTGAEMWRLTMEERGSKHERFPEADKWSISMYDCLKFADGTPSHWTVKRIKEIEAQCGTQSEIDMRVYGKFVVSEGRLFESFSIKDNVIPQREVPRQWHLYGGIDYGSGGESHPPAIIFVAVKPDGTYGRVISGWSGAGEGTVTATDIVMKYMTMRRDLEAKGLMFIGATYDWAAKDLATVASRFDEPLQPAQKSHTAGFSLMNSLFKNKMLDLDDDQEVLRLAIELSSLRMTDVNNKAAKNDRADALRYCVMAIPWQWRYVADENKKEFAPPEQKKELTDLESRRRGIATNVAEQSDKEAINEEIDEWNAAYTL